MKAQISGEYSQLKTWLAILPPIDGHFSGWRQKYMTDRRRRHIRQRQEFTVTAVTVIEEQSDGSTRVIWSAEGAQPLRYITYGAKYLI